MKRSRNLFLLVPFVASLLLFLSGNASQVFAASHPTPSSGIPHGKNASVVTGTPRSNIVPFASEGGCEYWDYLTFEGGFTDEPCVSENSIHDIVSDVYMTGGVGATSFSWQVCLWDNTSGDLWCAATHTLSGSPNGRHFYGPEVPATVGHRYQTTVTWDLRTSSTENYNANPDYSPEQIA